MAANDYTNIDVAKTVVFDRFGDVEDGELEALLVSSACRNEDGDPVYQPYLVAGWLMRIRWQQYVRVRSAAGSEVQYASPESAFETLQQLQTALSHGLSCPLNWAPQGYAFEVVF